MTRVVRLAVVAGAWLLVSVPTPAQEPAFEVISIKPRDSSEAALFRPQGPDRFVRPDTTLVQLIQYAYDVQDFQVMGGPDWIKSRRFEVSAKAGSAATDREMRSMVRRLLADRFDLKTHSETRESPTYELRTARTDRKLGERIRPSAIDCEPIVSSGIKPGQTADSLPQCLWRIAVMPAGARMSVDGISIPRFARLLEPMLRRPVVDATGLPGTYDIEFEFLPDQPGLPAAPRTPADAPPPRDGLSIFTALQEQLGLELDSRRGPVGVIIVEAATLPAAD